MSVVVACTFVFHAVLTKVVDVKGTGDAGVAGVGMAVVVVVVVVVVDRADDSEMGKTTVQKMQEVNLKVFKMNFQTKTKKTCCNWGH